MKRLTPKFPLSHGWGYLLSAKTLSVMTSKGALVGQACGGVFRGLRRSGTPLGIGFSGRLSLTTCPPLHPSPTLLAKWGSTTRLIDRAALVPVVLLEVVQERQPLFLPQ